MAFHSVINARAVLPQQRERLYIVAFRCEAGTTTAATTTTANTATPENGEGGEEEGVVSAHPDEEEENARLRRSAAAFQWPDLRFVPRCVREVLEEDGHHPAAGESAVYWRECGLARVLNSPRLIP